jgi:hypothetical protein
MSNLSSLHAIQCNIILGGRYRYLHHNQTLAHQYEGDDTIINKFLLFQQGDILQVINDDFTKKLFYNYNNSSDDIVAAILNVLKCAEDNSSLFLLAISCLQLYIHINYLGISYDFIELAQFFPNNSLVIANLSSSGEDYYEKLSDSYLLLVAKLILADYLPSVNFSCPTLSLWQLRYSEIHQNALLNRSNNLKQYSEACINQLISSLENKASPLYNPHNEMFHQELQSKVLIELSHYLLSYWQYNRADLLFKQILNLNGMELELTGIMGLRTKFQVEKKAQLILLLNTNTSQNKEKIDKNDAALYNNDEFLPKNLSYNSDTLLETAALDDSEEVSKKGLNHVERAILVLSMELSGYNNPVKHISKTEETLAYCNSIMNYNNNSNMERSWVIENYIIYTKALLEYNHSHKQEKSLLQLDDIVAQNSNKSFKNHAAAARIRAEDFYLLSYPHQYAVHNNIAELYEKLGFMKAALEIFEQTRQYDRIIALSIALGRKHSAEQMLQQQLILCPNSPLLYCLYGDLSGDEKYYNRAWEESNHNYPRAQRSLAKKAREEKQFKQAIVHYELALSINPIFPSEWYSLILYYTAPSSHQLSSKVTNVISHFEQIVGLL